MVETESANSCGSSLSSNAPAGTVQSTFSANLLASIEKLKGHDNYANWAFAMENYFKHCSLKNCLSGAETNAQKLSLAKTSLVFSLNPTNYVHVRNA